MYKVRFGKFSMNLPGNRWVRVGLGVGLIILGGVFGWLPVLGYWMVPLGFIILASDIPAIRRFNRRVTIKVVGWWNKRKSKEERKAARANGNGDGARRPAKPDAG